MAERFTGQPVISRETAGVPPLGVIVPSSFAEASATLPPREFPPVAVRNKSNVDRMWDYQKATQTACFFASLYSMHAVLRPEVELPDADWYLANIRPWYAGVLEEEKLLVRHDRLEEALKIYEDWGLRITHITRNSKARQLLEESLMKYQQRGLVADTGTSGFLDVEKFKPPYVVWMHEGVTNQAHFVAVDGTPESMEMVADYRDNKKYFPKMVIEAERSDKKSSRAEESGWEG